MLPFEPSLRQFIDRITKGAIEYTISQDFVAGHLAEQGRRLRGFHGEGNSNASLSGQQQQQQPIPLPAHLQQLQAQQ